jgi:hypothetical protein
MTRINTYTSGPAKYVAQQKLRAEIKQLEKVVRRIPASRQSDSPELSELAHKLTRLHGFRKHHESDQIDREDSTLQGSWLHNPVAPADSDWTDSERDLGAVESDGCRDGWNYGVLAEAPEKPGPRFHTPSWVRDRNQLCRFGQRLLRVYKKEHPTLADFVKSKAEVESRILFDYFVDHLEYDELYNKHRKPQNDIYDVSTKDAKSIQEAIEYAAEKNGTFAAFEEGGNVLWVLEGGETTKVTPCWFDYAENKFKDVSARKLNAEIFRVELHNEAQDAYYLHDELDPVKKASTRPLQRYIEALVNEGYKIMKIAKPTEADRVAARKTREAGEQREIARAKLGTGVNPNQWAHSDTISDESQDQTQATLLHIEYKRLASLEDRIKAEDAAKETQGLDAFQLWRREQARGEQAYQELMASTKTAEAVARLSRPWQPPADPESEPAVIPMPIPAPALPAAGHEILLMSIQVLLAAMGQGPVGEGTIPMAA